MLHSLLAYDAAGNVVATLEHMVARDDDGNATGLIDFGAHEADGGEHTDIWTVEHAIGSKVWPEWIGSRAHDFRVELAGPPGRKHIAALVHKTSGHRRERDAIVRHIVGGPHRPLQLDPDGKTIEVDAPTGTPEHLPIIGRK